ncbi:MAG: hypothetical protein VX112_05660, partial [Pseudomonadota bacterium]|nr:hypothetical protein [Pseudomonadota bacterium]
MQTPISYNQITHDLNPIQALRRLTKHTFSTISYMILPIFFALSGYGSAYATVNCTNTMNGDQNITSGGKIYIRDDCQITGDVSSGSDHLEMFIYDGEILGEVTINKGVANNHVVNGLVRVIGNGAKFPTFSMFTKKTVAEILMSYNATTGASDIKFLNTGNEVKLTRGTLDGNIIFRNIEDSPDIHAAGTVTIVDGNMTGSISMDGCNVILDDTDCDESNGCQGARVPTFSNKTTNSEIELKTGSYFYESKDIVFKNTGNVATLTSGELNGNIKFRNSDDTANAAGTVNVGDGSTRGTLAANKSIFMDGGTINIKTANATVPAIDSSTINSTVDIQKNASSKIQFQNTGNIATLTSGVLDGDIKFLDSNGANAAGTVNVVGGTLGSEKSIFMDGGTVNLTADGATVPAINSSTTDTTIDIQLSSGTTAASNIQFQNTGNIATLTSGELDGDIKFRDSGDTANAAGTVNVVGGTLGSGHVIHMGSDKDGSGNITTRGTVNLTANGATVPAFDSSTTDTTIDIQQNASSNIQFQNTGNIATLTSGELDGDIKFLNNTDNTANAAGTVNVVGGTLGSGHVIHMGSDKDGSGNITTRGT